MFRRGKKTDLIITLEQFDDAAYAVATMGGTVDAGPREEFPDIANDHFYVLARIALEGAGVQVP